MGYIANHAIVVEGYFKPFSWGDQEWPLGKAHHKAREIFGEFVTDITPRGVNGSAAFLVPPDGSKEGWDDSIEGDNRRDTFVTWLREQVYSDGSSPLDWVEVRFGGDEPRETTVVRHSGGPSASDE